MARSKGIIPTEIKVKGKFLAVAIVWLIYGSMLGCRRAQVQDPPVPTGTPTAAATFSPSQTAILSPTITLIPTIISTPGPVLNLDGPTSSIAYTIPLNIQHLTDDAATLFFEIDIPADGFLFYWPQVARPSEGKWVEFGKESTRHLIELYDLEQGEKLNAAVGLRDQSGSYHTPAYAEGSWDPIRVLPFDSQEGAVRIGVIGDSGFGDQVTESLAERILEHDIHMLIHTGDLVYFAEENPTQSDAYAVKFYTPFAEVLHQIPIYPVLGNHDYDRAIMWQDRPYYAQAFPQLLIGQQSEINPEGFRQYYALEIGSLQFLFLDSQAFWTGIGAGDQNRWLENRLENNIFGATIVVFHVPPYTSGLHINDGKILRQEWVPLFEQSNVILVISGHDHNYERLHANGITYLVSGGGSAVLYGLNEQLNESEIFIPRSHFLVLTLENSEISVAAIDVDGMILDAFRLQLQAN